MIEILNSRSGAATARINDIFFHSSYEPEKEADRICRREKLYNSNTLILIEPGLNYIAESVKKRSPGTKIISVYLHDYFFKNDSNKSDHVFQYRGDITRFKSFLSKSINEFDIENLKQFTLPSAEKSSPESTEMLQKILLQHIREIHGNIATISGFGKKQFKNYIRNYINTESVSAISAGSFPVLIAGSGPGLINSVDFIRCNRKRFQLLALPSAVRYLLHNKIKPDVIISTDPGYWAELHIDSSCTSALAVPFTAALPQKAISDGKVLLFRQKYFLDKYFFSNIPVSVLPPHGTVAGSALYYSLKNTTGPIIFSGLDFSYYDLLSHIRPHTFDNLLDSTSLRTDPITSVYFRRNILNSENTGNRFRTNQALKTYSGWFASNSDRFADRCFFLNSSVTTPGSFKSLSSSEAESLLSGEYNFKTFSIQYPDYKKRINNLKTILSGFSEYLNKISRQISSLIDFSDVFPLINNDFTFNICLAELIEFNHYYHDKNGKEVSDKAVSIINKAEELVGEYLNHVQ